ncbi:hypothetical protein F4802DRAFT_546018 [Xylaria palmicola]|nr:hypothetical protein F4802DRAFT_546018 [Xylaria palmicola]
MRERRIQRTPSNMALLSTLGRGKKSVADKDGRRSFGIGGAGNIRTRDQAMVHDAYDLVERRRSRLGSVSTQPSRGDSISRRSSSISEALKHVFSNSSK